MKTAMHKGEKVAVILHSTKNSRIRKDERFPDDTCLVPTVDLQFLSEGQIPKVLSLCSNRTAIPQNIWEQFVDLAVQLSPENLTCDGELPASKIRARRARILQDWTILEHQIGQKVTEDFIWDEIFKESRIKNSP